MENQTEENKKFKLFRREKKNGEPKKKKKFIKVLVGCGLAAVVVVFFIYSNATAANKGLYVMTAEASSGDVEDTVSTSGLVASEESRTYYSSVDAIVEDISVEVGDGVTLGQQLLSYDVDELQRAKKEAAYTMAEIENDYRSSMAKNSENITDFSGAAVNVEAYRAMVAAQRAYINDLKQQINQRAVDQGCLNEADSKKKAEIASKIAKLTAKLDDMTTVSGNMIKDPPAAIVQSPEYLKIEAEIAELQSESADIGDADKIAEATPEETRKLAEAETLLSDMQSYLSEDKATRDSAESSILNPFEKAKLEATRAKTGLSVEAADAKLEKAQTGVIADFNGIVTEVEVEKGAAVTAGSKLFKIENSDQVKVDISISKYDLDKIKIGQQVDIDIAGHEYQGEVSKIDRMAQKNESGTPVVGAEIHINNPDANVILGVEAKLVIHIAKAADVVLAPVETVNTDKDGDFCYAIDNGIIVKKRIETGISSDYFVEVVSGLKAGDVIISEVNPQIQEGVAATPMPSMDGMGMTDPAAAEAAGETADEAAAAETETETKQEQGAE